MIQKPKSIWSWQTLLFVMGITLPAAKLINDDNNRRRHQKGLWKNAMELPDKYTKDIFWPLKDTEVRHVTNNRSQPGEVNYSDTIIDHYKSDNVMSVYTAYYLGLQPYTTKDVYLTESLKRCYQEENGKIKSAFDPVSPCDSFAREVDVVLRKRLYGEEYPPDLSIGWSVQKLPRDTETFKILAEEADYNARIHELLGDFKNNKRRTFIATDIFPSLASKSAEKKYKK